MTTRYTIRPLGTWIEPVTTDRRSAGLFRVSWDRALDKLCAEVEHLGGHEIVLQVDITEAQLRQDGMLRTHAQVGGFPGVRVAFDSRHGPLTYATDAHEQRYSGGLKSWQANVYAVALGLEALRAVDRYGVSGRGEQYRGWAALAAEPAVMTPAQAAEFLAEWSGLTPHQASEVPVTAWKLAAKRAHPDMGGDADTFDRLTKACELLGGRR